MSGFFLAVPGPPPSKQDVDKMDATRVANYNALIRLLDSLDPENNETLQNLLQKSMRNKAYGHYVTGLLSGRAYWADGLCDCSDPRHKRSAHDQPDWLRGELTEPAPEDTGPDGAPDYTKADYSDLPVQPWFDWSQEKPDSAAQLEAWLQSHHGLSLSDIDREDMEEIFQVDHADDGSRTVRCRRCLTEYVSLEDRMIRLPDETGCQGCVQKTKWG
jgi:hypothetical protein